MHIRNMLVLAALSIGVGLGAARAQEAPAEAPTEAAPVADEGGTDTPHDAAAFSRQLRTVEEDVSSLKERVFRSKATLRLLKELIIEGAAVGSRVKVKHLNRLPRGYTMESVQYSLNGKNVFSRVDPGGGLDSERQFPVHEQSVPPGDHELQVNLVLRGSGFRVFSYVRSFRFNVQSNYTFKVEEGSATVLTVVSESTGGLKNFVERPNIRYEQRTETLMER